MNEMRAQSFFSPFFLDLAYLVFFKIFMHNFFWKRAVPRMESPRSHIFQLFLLLLLFTHNEMCVSWFSPTPNGKLIVVSLLCVP